MSDPVTGLTYILSQLKLSLDALKFYQRITNDLTAAPLIASIQATIVANVTAGVPVAGYNSVLAQSAVGIVGSQN